MRMSLVSLGKVHEPYVKQGIEEFTARIGHYFPCQWKILPAARKATSAPDIKREEAETILDTLQKDDFLVLLDEKGTQWTSEDLAAFIQTRANGGTKQLIFLIGGAYGVDPSIANRAQVIWSLSDLVFPHQLVRLILSEQVYRACSILRNEKYHHR
jgi:23S rRNA (pseudouridine1915-N3)-methyltransferase